MKILRKGKNIFNSTARITCEYCDAELEVTRSDLKECPREGVKPQLYRCICPCCERDLYFTASELPGIF